MKIAVCLRGHMRTYDRVAPYISELRKLHDVDIFINTWEDLGYFTHDYTKSLHYSNTGTINLNSGKINESVIKEFYETDFVVIESYENRRAEFESITIKFAEWYEFIKHDPTVDLTRVHGFMSQLYKEQAVIQQKDLFKSSEYDIVIETRPDISMNISGNILEEINQSNNNSLWINRLNFDYATEVGAAWVCNSFFIGKEPAVNVLGNLYSDIMMLLANHYTDWQTTKDYGTYSRMFCIHRLCWYYINKNNITMIADNRLSGTIIR